MKLFHISDLHFGYHHEHIIEPFLQEIREEKPDAVLVSGDLTQRAKKDQYQQCRDFFQQIPCEVYFVPGNHDIPLYNLGARWLQPFRRFKDKLDQPPFCMLRNETIRLLGVNSVNPYRIKSGRLSHTTMQTIRNFFDPTFKGFNLLFFHHNFDYLEGFHKPLKNYRELIRYVKEVPVHLICTGHLHYANIAQLKTDGQHSSVILHAGSLLCQRKRDQTNSYYQIALNAAESLATIKLREFKEGCFHTALLYQMDYKKNHSSLER